MARPFSLCNDITCTGSDVWPHYQSLIALVAEFQFFFFLGLLLFLTALQKNFFVGPKTKLISYTFCPVHSVVIQIKMMNAAVLAEKKGGEKLGLLVF